MSEQLCVHGNRIIIITWDNISLGDEIARCPYKGKVPNFNPYDLETIKTVCKGLCKINRQNVMVEKLAFERAKILSRRGASLLTKEELDRKSIADATKGS